MRLTSGISQRSQTNNEIDTIGMTNLYIYIKPKLLKLPQFSTSSLLKKKKFGKKQQTKIEDKKTIKKKKKANENRG